MIASSQGSKRTTGEQRARSVPHKGPFISALIYTVAFYLCLVGLFAATFAFFIRENLPAAFVLIGFLLSGVVLWILSYFKRRAARCPLCKGTPFLDSAAHCHVKASRIFPLNYGTSNVIRSITSQKFRCPYCGIVYDLFKSVDKQGPRHR
jgi:ACR3 family arsenite efflux pump ArsB